MTQATLRVPPNTPLMWGNWESTIIKMPCPSPGCGGFTMTLHRHEGGGIKSLACENCGLSGLEATQRAFDNLQARQAAERRADAKAHETAMSENHTHLQMTKEKRKAAA